MWRQGGGEAALGCEGAFLCRASPGAPIPNAGPRSCSVEAFGRAAPTWPQLMAQIRHGNKRPENEFDGNEKARMGQFPCTWQDASFSLLLAAGGGGSTQSHLPCPMPSATAAHKGSSRRFGVWPRSAPCVTSQLEQQAAFNLRTQSRSSRGLWFAIPGRAGILAPRSQKGGLPWEAAIKLTECFPSQAVTLHLEDLPCCRALGEHGVWPWLSGGSTVAGRMLMLFLWL